jgi:hypothetical protein
MKLYQKDMSKVMTGKKRVIRRVARPASEQKISMNCFAAVPRGAEEIAAAELQALDIQGASAGRDRKSVV